ncbi:MAG: hypothetical protein R3B96_17990 [Pirellulaceae bacterium]
MKTWGSRLNVQSLMQGQRVRVALPHTGSDSVPPVSMLIDRQANEITLEGAATLVGAWQTAIDALDQAARPNAEGDSAWIPVSRPNDPELQRAISFLRLAASPTADEPEVMGPAPRTSGVPARTVSAANTGRRRRASGSRRRQRWDREGSGARC